MNLRERDAACDRFFRQCMELIQLKGSDYNRGDEAYYVTRRQAESVGVDMLRVLWMHAVKHVVVIESHVLNPRDGLRHQHVEDRLMDLANFCAFIHTYMKLYHGQEEPTSTSIEVLASENIMAATRPVDASWSIVRCGECSHTRNRHLFGRDKCVYIYPDVPSGRVCGCDGFKMPTELDASE